MSDPRESLTRIRTIARVEGDRVGKSRRIAAALRDAGPYRWVGIYDVTPEGVAVVAWSGPGPPAHPSVPAGRGLCGAAVSSRATVVAPDVTKDPRYLATLGSTRSEIVVPVLGQDDGGVRGLIDVESDRVDAFGPGDRQLLEEAAVLLRPLWESRSPG